jgi:hypothetical protein
MFIRCPMSTLAPVQSCPLERTKFCNGTAPATHKRVCSQYLSGGMCVIYGSALIYIGASCKLFRLKLSEAKSIIQVAS